MKTTLAVVLLTLALSLCNLMGKRGNTDTNGNSRSSGEMSEASPTPSPETQPSKRNDNTQRTLEIQSIPSPPTPERRDVQKAPPTSAAPGAPPSSMPSANHNSAASAPPPPPKAAFTPAPPPKTISGGVLNGKAINLPKPAYPATARAVHASGAVNVQVTVDENGNVISASAVSGHPLLRQSAVAAARQAKFRPTMLSGQPVKVTGVIVYNFVAQ